MTNLPKIEKCVWCGSECFLDGADWCGYWVRCGGKRCVVSGPKHETKRGAINAWNRVMRKAKVAAEKNSACKKPE